MLLINHSGTAFIHLLSLLAALHARIPFIQNTPPEIQSILWGVPQGHIAATALVLYYNAKQFQSSESAYHLLGPLPSFPYQFTSHRPDTNLASEIFAMDLNHDSSVTFLHLHRPYGLTEELHFVLHFELDDLQHLLPIVDVALPLPSSGAQFDAAQFDNLLPELGQQTFPSDISGPTLWVFMSGTRLIKLTTA